MPPTELILNVAVGGILTGLIYGLMALGLSVIYGVIRVVNFAHGEMMTIAMFLAVVAFAAFKVDPLVMIVPIAIVLFALASAFMAAPAYAVTAFPADLEKGAAAQSAHTTSNDCEQSRFGCSLRKR